MNTPLENKLHFKFKNEKLLDLALTHRSYLNENKTFKDSNERLEFLGDAVLEFWSSKKLYTLFPQYHEGQLTNLRSLLVCTKNLAEVSHKFNLGEYIKLSHGEEAHGGRNNQSLLADTFESLLGAIYLDSGIKAANRFLDRFLLKSLLELSKKEVYKDPKSIFQEIAQAKKGITPTYKTVSENGPDHQKIFQVAVFIGNKLIATGKGNSKQRAEEDAATKAANLIV